MLPITAIWRSSARSRDSIYISSYIYIPVSLSRTLNLTVNVDDSLLLPATLTLLKMSGLISPSRSAASAGSFFPPLHIYNMCGGEGGGRQGEASVFSHPCSVVVLCAAQCKTSSGCHLRARSPTPLGGRTPLQGLKFKHKIGSFTFEDQLSSDITLLFYPKTTGVSTH